MSEQSSSKTYLYYLFFFFSGIAALLYEVIWTKKLALIFGVSTYAVSTTLSIFMLGLALGSWYFGRLADSRRNPLRLYAMLEGGIALSAALSVVLLEVLNRWIANLGFSSASSVGFTACRLAASFVVLIIPTFLMGGTLPVLAREVIRSSGVAGRKLGSLYAVNTFGGMLGCLLGGFVAIPVFGMRGTLLSGVLLNALVAMLAYRSALSNSSSGETKAVEADSEKSDSPPNQVLARAMLFAFFAAGFVGLGAEVAWTRMMLLNMDATAQIFSGMLAVYLLGLGVGSAVAGRLSDKLDAAKGYGILQVMIALSIVFSMFVWAATDFSSVAASIANTSNYAMFKFAFCIMQSVLLVFLPTLLMGFAFPFGARFFASEVKSVGHRLGKAYMLNTLGAMLGPLLCGFWWLPSLGIQRSVLICAVIAALAGSILLFAAKAGKLRFAALLSCALLVITLLIPDRIALVTYGRQDGKLLHYEEDIGGSVAILEKSTPFETYRQLNVGVTSMISDNFRCQRYTRLIGHLPMLMHAAPKKALVICLGSGMTLSAIASHPDVESVDCVDLSAGVINASRKFFGEVNGNVLDNPRVHLIVNDGRTHLMATSERYDVIALEPPPPNNAGVANLYSEEFYELCKSRLNPGGMVAQWIPYHGATFPQLRSQIGTMQRVFQTSTLWNILDGFEYCLVGHSSDEVIPHQRLAERFEKVKGNISPVGLRSVEDVLACFVMGPQPMKKFTEGAPLITDDHPGLGYDLSAFAQLMPHTAELFRDVQMASMVTMSFAEDPTAFFNFQDDNARTQFRLRVKEPARAWLMQNRTFQLIVLAAAKSTKTEELAKDFVVPLQVDPTNAWFKYIDRTGAYHKVCMTLAKYYESAGKSDLARRWTEESGKYIRQ